MINNKQLLLDYVGQVAALDSVKNSISAEKKECLSESERLKAFEKQKTEIEDKLGPLQTALFNAVREEGKEALFCDRNVDIVTSDPKAMLKAMSIIFDLLSQRMTLDMAKIFKKTVPYIELYAPFIGTLNKVLELGWRDKDALKVLAEQLREGTGEGELSLQISHKINPKTTLKTSKNIQ